MNILKFISDHSLSPKSLRELKQERDAAEERSRNRARSSEQGGRVLELLLWEWPQIATHKQTRNSGAEALQTPNSMQQTAQPARVTPKKKLMIQRLAEPPRRSPRKHASSSRTAQFADSPHQRSGFATVKITGNAIVTPGAGGAAAAHRTPLSKTSSFTMLDPTSTGIPGE